MFVFFNLKIKVETGLIQYIGQKYLSISIKSITQVQYTVNSLIELPLGG